MRTPWIVFVARNLCATSSFEIAGAIKGSPGKLGHFAVMELGSVLPLSMVGSSDTVLHNVKPIIVS